MNKFERVTAILIYLQTRSVITAKDLADRFAVSERTIYRDIRALETAGVPIGSEAGLGYFLEKGYRLPPMMFSRDQAAALLIGAKFIDSRVDAATRVDYLQAMDKIKAVLESSDQDFLSAIDDSIVVHNPASTENTAEHDTWLHECRTALARTQVALIDYCAVKQPPSQREIEAIGLYYYGQHWHLIAWCRLRQDYRDFRLDRIQSLALQPEQYRRREHPSLSDYIDRDQTGELREIVLRFSPGAARYVGEQRYMFGFSGHRQTDEGTEMTFLTSQLDFIGRWLLQYCSGVEILQGDELREVMTRLSRELSGHWLISS